jgi:hypothetical protein
LSDLLSEGQFFYVDKVLQKEYKLHNE